MRRSCGGGGEMFSLPEIQSCLSESGLPQCTFSHMNKGKNRPPWWKGSARAELADRWKMRHLPSVRWPSSRSKAQAARQLQDLSFLPRKKSLDYQALDQLKMTVFPKHLKNVGHFRRVERQVSTPNGSHLIHQAEDVETSTVISPSTFPLLTVRSKKLILFCLRLSAGQPKPST